MLFLISSKTPAKGKPTTSSANYIHIWTDIKIRVRIPKDRIHHTAPEIWTCWNAQPDRDSNQNLVSKQKSQRQTHREGTDGPAYEVWFNHLGTGDLQFYQFQGLSSFWGLFLFLLKHSFICHGSQFSSLFTILQELIPPPDHNVIVVFEPTGSWRSKWCHNDATIMSQ